MPNDPIPYKKLPGRGSSILTYSRLYRAEDHLLQVVSTGFTESYLRFYFGDIQLITIRKTHMGMITNAALIAILAIFSPLFFVANAEFGAYFVALVLGVPLVVNFALGPTCVTHVQTAVQRQKLSSLGRLGSARKTLKSLLPLIEAVQGPMPDDVLHGRFAYQPPPPSAIPHADADTAAPANSDAPTPLGATPVPPPTAPNSSQSSPPLPPDTP